MPRPPPRRAPRPVATAGTPAGRVGLVPPSLAQPGNRTDAGLRRAGLIPLLRHECQRGLRPKLAGAAEAAQGITTTTSLDDVAEPGTLTGSYALLVSCGLAGSAAGYAAGGALLNAVGIRDTLLAAAAAGLAAAGWYASRAHTLQPLPGTRAPHYGHIS